MTDGDREMECSTAMATLISPPAAAAPSSKSDVNVSDITHLEGLTLVHFSDHRKHSFWNTMATFIRYMGHKSSQTGHKTAH